MYYQDPYCDYGHFGPQIVVEQPPACSPVIVNEPYTTDCADDYSCDGMFYCLITGIVVILIIIGLIALFYFLFPFGGQSSPPPTNTNASQPNSISFGSAYNSQNAHLEFDAFQNFRIQTDIVNKDSKLKKK